MKDMMTVDELAEMLRVSKFTVYNWVKSGKIRALRAGGSFRFLLEDVERFLLPKEAGAS